MSAERLKTLLRAGGADILDAKSNMSGYSEKPVGKKGLYVNKSWWVGSEKCGHGEKCIQEPVGERRWGYLSSDLAPASSDGQISRWTFLVSLKRHWQLLRKIHMARSGKGYRKADQKAISTIWWEEIAWTREADVRVELRVYPGESVVSTSDRLKEQKAMDALEGDHSQVGWRRAREG